VTGPTGQVVLRTVAGRIYQSVVAEGRLEPVPRDELTVERIEQYGRAERPLFELWTETRHDLDVELYELEPDTLSGRRVERDPGDAGG